MAAAMIAGLPTLLVYVLAGKYFVRGLTPARSRDEQWALNIRNVRKVFGKVDRARRHRHRGRVPASSSSWSAPRAAARAPCST
jgi:hypothetical protein